MRYGTHICTDAIEAILLEQPNTPVFGKRCFAVDHGGRLATGPQSLLWSNTPHVANWITFFDEI
ncbi:MAG TPA: hypothetical protein VKR42_01915 [Ktedonobacteraceae bacterium]|nr:hypothetical protein [Ktedonobacteraceae bacterium]